MKQSIWWKSSWRWWNNQILSQTEASTSECKMRIRNLPCIEFRIATQSTNVAIDVEWLSGQWQVMTLARMLICHYLMSMPNKLNVLSCPRGHQDRKKVSVPNFGCKLDWEFNLWRSWGHRIKIGQDIVIFIFHGNIFFFSFLFNLLSQCASFSKKNWTTFELTIMWYFLIWMNLIHI